MKKAKDGRFWNSRPAGPGATEFHVGWVHYLDADDRWQPIDCALVEDATGFGTDAAPFRFHAPRFADEAAYFESNCRYDIFGKSKITAAPLGQHITALDATHVPGRRFDMNGDGRPDAVLYEGAFPQWGADLIFYVRHGRAPRLEKLIRFQGAIRDDIAARFRIAYTGGVEISPRHITGARRAAIWNRRGRLRHRQGYYIRALGEPQKRGIGVKTPRIWDSNPRAPMSAEIEATLVPDGDALVLTKHVPAAFFTPEVVYPVYTDTTSTFYPDADTESTSVDGLARTDSGPKTWSATHSATGDQAYPSVADNFAVNAEAHTTTDRWRYNQRSIFLFDTTSLPDADAILSATLTLTAVTSGKDNAVGSIEAVLVSSSPASNTDIVASDYAFANFGTTEFASRIGYSSWNAPGTNDFVLNGSGLANISKTGVSKFGVLHGFDFDNTEPTWAGGNAVSRLGTAYSEKAGTGSDPLLTIIHGANAVLVQAGASYTVKATAAAKTKALGYSLTGAGGLVQVGGQYRVHATPAPVTKASTYRLPAPVVAKTLRYEVTAPYLSGVIKDRQGNPFDCATYNVRVNVYPVNNASSPPVGTQLVTDPGGAWTITGLAGLTKYLVTFEFEGVYTPLGDQDIADAAFMTASL